MYKKPKRKSISKKKREIIKAKFNGKCAYCGIELTRMHVDHVIPHEYFPQHILNKWQPDFLSHLGVDDLDHMDNYFPSCPVCNAAKYTFSVKGFKREMQKQAVRAKKTSRNYRLSLKYGLIIETDVKIKFYFEDFIVDGKLILDENEKV